MKSQGLKEIGLKITHPRMKILAILERADNHHMSAEDIYRTLLADHAEVSLATVYRVLMQFHAAGIVKRHNFENDHSVFELNDGNHHDHLVCIKCNKVFEFFDEIIETRQSMIACKIGFQMIHHSLNIHGLCENCKIT